VQGRRVPLTPPSATTTRQHGQTLPLVIVFLIMFSIGVVTVAELSGAVGRDSKRENSHDAALDVAEAGTATALSVLSNAPRPLNPATLPSSGSPQVDTVDGGTVAWYGDLTGDTWTINATSSVPNPAGGGALSRTVRMDVRVGSTAVNQAWNYVFADSGGCLNLANSAVIKDPLYTRGSLCMGNSASITGSPVQVEGTIDTSSSSSIGAPGSPIAELHVGGGCRYGGSGSYVFPCTATEHVYATSADQSPAGLVKPPVDLAYWYAKAAPGPSQACTTGTFPGGFDNDAAMNRSLPDVDLFASSYDCSVIVGGTQVGRIAYAAGNPGTLVIDGTVFFDGNIVMNGSQQVVYSGRGTIYASGKIVLRGSQQICGAWAAGCDFAGWQPSTSMLVLVAGSSTDTPGFRTGQTMQFQGGIYAVGNYVQGSSAQVQGPRIADAMTFWGSSQPTFPAYTYLPPGAPMAEPLVTVNSWR
jgi:hypothetical protein